MNSYLAKVISDYFYKNNIISSEKLPFFEYGLYLIVSSLTTFLSIMLLSVLFGKFLISLVFSLSFFIIRSLCGGYHCTNSAKCYFVSLLIYLIFVFGSSFSTCFIESFLLVATFIGIVVIILLSPISNKNNEVSDTRKHKSKFIVLCICFIHILFLIICSSPELLLFKYAISYSIAGTAMLLIVEKIRLLIAQKNIYKENNYEE